MVGAKVSFKTLKFTFSFILKGFTREEILKNIHKRLHDTWIKLSPQLSKHIL